jgi:uncharacterized protein (TIGR03086 family)
MRGSPDATGGPEADDDEMDVQKLMLLGRDREAAELAATHLRHDLTDTEPPTRGELKMGPLEQLDELEPLLGLIASGITPDQLDAPTPCAEFTVRGVLGHVIGGATQFAAAFRGEPQPEVPSGVADGPDVVERAGNALGGLTAAIRLPGALDGNVLGPFGEMPGDAFARFVVLDGLVHGWDLATATHQSYEPSDALVAAVDAFARQAIMPEMRDGQTFAAATEASDGATPIERLAAYTGRTT